MRVDNVLWLVLLWGGLLVQYRQSLGFIHENSPTVPPNTQRIVFAMVVVYGCFSLCLFYVSPIPIKNLLFLLAITPLVILDALKYWLPLCFTNTFWLAGLLSATLPPYTPTPGEALVSGLLAFGVMHLIYTLSCRFYLQEAIGRGDVHLIAGLFAWLPAIAALHIIGIGFLLMAAGIYISQKAQPYAPYLFLALAGYGLIV